MWLRTALQATLTMPKWYRLQTHLLMELCLTLDFTGCCLHCRPPGRASQSGAELPTHTEPVICTWLGAWVCQRSDALLPRPDARLMGAYTHIGQPDQRLCMSYPSAHACIAVGMKSETVLNRAEGCTCAWARQPGPCALQAGLGPASSGLALAKEVVGCTFAESISWGPGVTPYIEMSRSCQQQPPTCTSPLPT